MYNRHTQFEFDPEKEARNIEQHGIDFETAKRVFDDPDVIYLYDAKHSKQEDRWHAIGKIRDGRIITVWFTYREAHIRLIGAAEFRSGRQEYEKVHGTRLFKDEEG